MQVERRLGRDPERGLLGLRVDVKVGGCVEHGPVVADGGGQALRTSDRLFHSGQVPGGVVTRGPVGPEPVEMNAEVVSADCRLCQRGLEEEHVEAAFHLFVGEEGRPPPPPPAERPCATTLSKRSGSSEAAP